MPVLRIVDETSTGQGKLMMIEMQGKLECDHGPLAGLTVGQLELQNVPPSL
jgi:hypothetical protein